MKKILGSILTLGIVASFVLVATNAFFSDTETSTGNTFAAGDIDLRIGNSSYVVDYLAGVEDPDGSIVESGDTTWELSNLTVERFFDFEDLKPGDFGEDTIEIQVGSNDAWVCAAAQVTEDAENNVTEPEADDDDTEGELDEEVNFAFWIDDGDNVYEDDEGQVILQGSIADIGGTGQIALADATGGILGLNGPVEGGKSYYIGKYWCMGEIDSSNPADPQETGNPATRNETGFDCDGTDVTNMSQTDSVVVDLAFYAEQARNNDEFSCANDWNPDFTPDQPEVGALLSAYDAPECTTTVSAGNSIQTAIDSAAANDIVCLEDGDHDADTYPLELDKDITLAGENGPLSSAALDGGILVQSSGATITGLILGNSTQGDPNPYSIFLTSGSNNVTISYNIIEGPGNGAGILATFNGNNDNVIVTHNRINNWTQGIITQTSDGWSITYNDIYGTVAGIANDYTTNMSVMYNVIRDNDEGIGIFTDTGAAYTANYNNLYNNTKALASYGDEVVDAENNWWGDITPADEISISGGGSVDYDPFANSAYPEN